MDKVLNGVAERIPRKSKQKSPLTSYYNPPGPSHNYRSESHRGILSAVPENCVSDKVFPSVPYTDAVPGNCSIDLQALRRLSGSFFFERNLTEQPDNSKQPALLRNSQNIISTFIFWTHNYDSLDQSIFNNVSDVVVLFLPVELVPQFPSLLPCLAPSIIILSVVL